MKVLIVDGMNLFIRCFVVVPTTDTNGEPVGGITGFLKSLKALVGDSAPSRVVVAWDGEGGSVRRRRIYKDYKEGRKVRLNRQEDMETQDESFVNMGSQVAKLKHLLSLLGVLNVEASGVEADDAIALICRYIYPDVDKVVLTSDRDMLQLVDSRTIVYSPTKRVYWSSDVVKEKTGVLPENYIYVKALMGDKSDNIEGLGGVGEKTAVKLFPFLGERPTDLQEIRDHAEANRGKSPRYTSVLDQWDRFLENVKLMQLSSPIINPSSATTIRNSATGKPSFMFTELRLQLVRYGIQVVDPDLLGVFKAYKFRAEGAA